MTGLLVAVVRSCHWGSVLFRHLGKVPLEAGDAAVLVERLVGASHCSAREKARGRSMVGR